MTIPQLNLNKCEISVLLEISLFSKKRDWKFGLQQKYLYFNIFSKGFSKNEIEESITKLQDQNVIYIIWKYGKPYWFISKEFRK